MTVLVLLSETRQACGGIISGIYRWANAHNWNVHVVERAGESGDVAKLLRFWSPDGCIVEAGGSIAYAPEDFGRIPTVFIDRDSLETPNHDVVRLDCASLGEQAAQVLLSCDFAQYVYVAYPDPRFWCRERRESFLGAMRLNGIVPLVFDAPEKDLTHWAQKLLEWLKGVKLPCGIFAANDTVAAEVLQICKGLGLEVPRDATIVGVDDDKQLCENTQPSLASFALDREKAGFLAAQTLEARIRHPDAKRKDVLYPVLRLVKRLSLRRGGNVAMDAHVFAMLDVIHRRSCQGISSRDVAQVAGCSRRLAELRFREACGRSIGDELRAVRHENACDLLRSSGLPILAVAESVGYSSEDALEKLFLKLSGCSPYRWRERELKRRFS